MAVFVLGLFLYKKAGLGKRLNLVLKHKTPEHMV